MLCNLNDLVEDVLTANTCYDVRVPIHNLMLARPSEEPRLYVADHDIGIVR